MRKTGKTKKGDLSKILARFTPTLEKASALFPDFPGKFQVALIRYDVASDIPVQETAAYQIRLINMIKLWENKIFIQAMDRNAVALLLPLRDNNQNWYRRLESLRDELNLDADYSLYFSMSDIFSKPLDLPRAWRQLQFIHATPGIDDLVSVQRIKDTASGDAQLPVNIGMSQMIYNALCNGNAPTACAILEECTASLEADENYLLPALVFNMLHDMIILLKLENPDLLSDINIPRYERGNEDELFKKQFPECFSQIAQRIRNSREDSFNSFGRKVIDYINEHLYNPELYSTMVLDHFNISQPTLQKLMKIITSRTFLVYVETRRLEKAMQMLSVGGYSVQEISSSCGFSKTDSFYKAFKRTYGFAPSSMLHEKVNSTS